MCPVPVLACVSFIVDSTMLVSILIVTGTIAILAIFATICYTFRRVQKMLKSWDGTDGGTTKSLTTDDERVTMLNSSVAYEALHHGTLSAFGETPEEATTKTFSSKEAAASNHTLRTPRDQRTGPKDGVASTPDVFPKVNFATVVNALHTLC